MAVTVNYPAIPQPTTDVNSLWNTVMALKQTSEILTGAVGGANNPAAAVTVGSLPGGGIGNPYAGALIANALNGVGFIAPGVNGIVGNGAASDDDAFEAMLNTYTRVLLAPGNYFISRPLKIDATKYPVIEGLGLNTRLLASPSFSGGNGVFNVTGNGGCTIRNLWVNNKTAGSGALWGINVNAAGPINQSIYFDGVVSSGFSVNWLLQSTSSAQQARLMRFNRCAAWPNDSTNTQTSGETGWYLLSNGGGFVGDMDFDSCQSVASNASGANFTITDQSTATGLFGGIRFNKVVSYHGLSHYLIELTGANTRLEDIWWNPGTQMEGATGFTSRAINALLNAAGSSMINAHTDHCYMSGNGFQSHIVAQIGASGGTFDRWWITDNDLANPSNVSVEISGTNGTAKGITVAGNTIAAPGNAGGVGGVYLENVGNCDVSRNKAVDVSTTSSVWVEVNNPAAGDYVDVSHNNSGGASTTPSTVTGGIQLTHSTNTDNI